MNTGVSRVLIVLMMLMAAAFWWAGPEGGLVPEAGVQEVAESAQAGFLPPEAQQTVSRILAAGPHPYPQDGTVFFNREGHLPQRERGHYREYTVDTPGLNHRGARRIVTGGSPPQNWYYTDDHYQSFRPFVMAPR